MTDSDSEHRIYLVDNSDRPASQANMSATEDKENVQPQGGSEDKENAQPQKEGSSWMSKPGDLGDAAGGKIQSALNPVGQYAGKGFETAAAPIGGLVGPTAGAVMEFGKGWGDQLGVGFGNEGGGPAKQQEAEGQRMKEPVGGKEQSGDNPLGL